MNYLLHNCTHGYEDANGVSSREIILSTLKNYGLFAHIRDYSISQLDLYDVNKWLIPTQHLYDEIKELKANIKKRKKELKELSDDIIELEWKKEVDRLNWYNNPKSNYYTAQVKNISTVLDKFAPQLQAFNRYCDVTWVKEVVCDVLTTVRSDLNKASISEIEERNKREESPYEIPTFESFKKKYIKDEEYWIAHFKEQIESKKKNISRYEKDNEMIKNIFLSLDLMEKDFAR